MNAYELAKGLDQFSDLGGKFFCESANMLRQQADRIAHLEMLVANRNEIIDKLDLTTPQIKELSDEEINETAQQCWVYPQDEQAIFNQHKFAKAILKKASDK